MSAFKARSSASFGRLLMLFSSIMFFFLALTSDQTHKKIALEEEKRQNLQEISSLDDIIAATTLEGFIRDQILDIHNLISRSDFSQEKLDSIVETKARDSNTFLKCFYYENLILKKSLNATKEENEFFSELIAQTQMTGEDFLIAQRKVHQPLLNFFGPGNRLELMAGHQGKISRFKHLQKDRFFYWNLLPDQKAVFLIITDFPSFSERFKKARTIMQRSDTGAGDPTRKEFITPDGIDADQMQAAKIKSALMGKACVIEFNKKWSFVENEEGQFFCTVQNELERSSTIANLVYSVNLISVILTAVIFILYLLSIFEINPGNQLVIWLDSLSIRFRIVGLFFMASVFPVLFTALIGATSIADRVEIVENQVIGESLANLNRLEAMASIKLDQSEKMAQTMRNKILHQPATEDFFCYWLNKFDLPRSLSRLEVRDGAGTTLFTTDDPEVHGVVQAMDVFSKVALKQHAPHRLGQKANLVTPAEVVSESVLSTDEIGMATILRQRGRQWLFRMGTFPTVWYYDVFPELASGPAFMHYATQLQTVYNHQIEKNLALSRQNPESLLLKTELNYHYQIPSLYPSIDEIDEKMLLNAAIVSLKTGKVVFRNTNIKGVPYWVTIKPEKSVTTTVFFNLISKPVRLAVLAPLKSQLIASGVLALMVALLGAMLLIKLFIQPIGDLANGITAIRERQHDFRIEVRRRDEFGALSLAFNKVIEELKELEYGKIVQESLLPSIIPVPAGYDLACFRTSATDLAGDYHDVLPLDDGRLAIILGDVTGHGISAALAMAMAKASVDYWNLEGKFFPVQVMDQLNALFNRELKPRHKFMTLVTMVLNPANGELQVDNAGQSYPFLYQKSDDLASEIAIPSMPLGAGKKRRSKVETRILQSGDTIILYSDGIIECSDLSGEMFGYDRFKQTFVDLVKKNLSSKQILQQMMTDLDKFRKPGPYPDDVTLVLLRKQ
ncbi:MAG: SpoIIE family protein phosphatase [Candidatus Rifleibacteriota bacterium]